MYSPGLMEDRNETRDFQDLEARVLELESLADNLGDVPDDELAETLGRAVELLREVNAGIEEGVQTLGEESREVGGLLERIDFGAFDAALSELEQQERDSGERSS